MDRSTPSNQRDRNWSLLVTVKLTPGFEAFRGRCRSRFRESVMRIPVKCRHCSNEFTASEKAVGKRVNCPDCGQAVRVSDTSDEASEMPSPRTSKNRKGKGGTTASNGSSTLLIGIGVGGIGVAALVLVVLQLFPRGGNPPAVPANTAPSNTSMAAAAPTTTSQMSPAMNPPQIAANNPAATVLPPVQPVPRNVPNTNNTSSPSVAANQLAAPRMRIASSSAKPDAPMTEPDTKTLPASNAPRQLMEMTELVKTIERSVVRIIVKGEQGASVGSGFVVETDGSIMTNYHVIEGAVSAEVEFESGKKAAVIGFTTVDKDRDLAVIKIDPAAAELFKVRIASSLPAKGEKVAAFGAPRGLSFTASDGIISAIRTTPEFNARAKGTYLQTTTPISPGNSGGPLVNMYGEVVGVNSFKVEGENLNFAASSLDIQEVISHPATEMTPLSPRALERVFTKKNPFARAEKLARTTKGNMLLGNIDDAIIMMIPFADDPTGNILAFVDREISKSLIKRAKWTEVTRRDQVKKSTAVVVALVYFTADPKNANAVELMCSIQIVARDVDKDGIDYVAIVYDENESMGKISLNSLVNGNIPNGMKKGIPDFFAKIVQDFRKAQRANANPDSK